MFTNKTYEDQWGNKSHSRALLYVTVCVIQFGLPMDYAVKCNPDTQRRKIYTNLFCEQLDNNA